jgi:hypothetical protein
MDQVSVEARSERRRPQAATVAREQALTLV